MGSLKELCDGLPLDPLPQPRPRDESVAHAPVRNTELNASETRVILHKQQYGCIHVFCNMGVEFNRDTQYIIHLQWIWITHFRNYN